MNISAFLRSFSTRSSRYVIHQDEYSEPEFEADDAWSCTTTNNTAIGASASLTVWRKSLLFSCHGFTVIDSNGDLVYRVENYMGGRPEEIVLMGGSGQSILILVRAKKLKLSDSWQVYKGEESSEHCGAKLSTKPIYTVKKQFNIIRSTSSTKVLAYVYRGATEKNHSYTIRGSYSNRSCKILDGWANVVAEIKKKEMTVKGGQGVSFGMEVFVLVVQPGFDQGVAMGLVLLLDQMFS